MKKLFYDLETTGTDYRIHAIHSLSGIIEVNGKVKHRFKLLIRPFEGARIDPAALEKGRVTAEQIQGYPSMENQQKKFVGILSTHVNRYDATDKLFTVGFRNTSFDDPFLRAWFTFCGDTFYGSWFWSNGLDVSTLATQYLLDRRIKMPSFKLHRVAKELGIVVDDSKLHDSDYDVILTRKIYRIVTGLEIEL